MKTLSSILIGQALNSLPENSGERLWAICEYFRNPEIIAMMMLGIYERPEMLEKCGNITITKFDDIEQKVTGNKLITSVERYFASDQVEIEDKVYTENEAGNMGRGYSSDSYPIKKVLRTNHGQYYSESYDGWIKFCEKNK